ncbi:MAG TPA: hypothetical protein VD838_11865, partial [Anaeromyxobacteraceae bacterium]|nr:hypothetical protein [Anaeromyxobacteraceae bacterium]
MRAFSPSAPGAAARDELAEARTAQQERLHELAAKLMRGLIAVPGPIVWGLMLVQAIARGDWQLWALFGTSFAMWASWFFALWCAKRGRLEGVSGTLFFSVWMHTGASLALREGGFGSTTLAAIGVMVVVWLIAPRYVWRAAWMNGLQFAALRILALTDLLPTVPVPEISSVVMDAGLSLTLLPVFAFVLKLGSE